MVVAKIIPDGFDVNLRTEYLKGMSEEEFFDFCQDNPQLRMERTTEGEIIFMSPSGFQSSNLSNEVALELGVWNRTAKFGKIADSSGGFTLPDGSVRAADVALVSFHRLAQVKSSDLLKFPPLTPNFIVEIISPSDSIAEQQAKMVDWMNNGVELGWLIDPQTEQVWVYLSDTQVQSLQGFNGELSGDPVLPGFSLSLSLLKG